MTAAAHYLFWSSLLLIFYIYIGYPLMVLLLAKWFPKPIEKSPFTGTCSILIASCNEADNLKGKLESIHSQTINDSILEILIGSDGSTDHTGEVIASFSDSRIRLIEFEERRGKPAVLNDLMKECRGDVVVMNDARQRLKEDALEKLLMPLSDPSVGVVSGELVFLESWKTGASKGIEAYWRYEKMIRNAEGKCGSVPGATGALYAIRRELLRDLPAETILDDVAIPMLAVEAGYRCVFELGAIVYDVPSATALQESIRKRRTISGVGQLVRLYPRWLLPWRNPVWIPFISHKVLRLISPILLLIMFISNALCLGGLVYYLIFTGQFFFYLIALLGIGLRNIGMKSAVVSIPLMFVTLNYTTLLALLDVLRGSYKITWVRAYK